MTGVKMTVRTRFAAVVLSIGSIGIGACATNPATGRRQFSLMSEGQEVAIGREQDLQVRKEMGVYNDRALQEWVSSVGLKLAQTSERPNLPWHFTVVDVPAVNAFALPGGYIYITRGILPFLNDEAQLAGVLGHEIGHVTARHSAAQYSRATTAQLGVVLGSIFVPGAGGAAAAELGATGLSVLFLKYGRDDEIQADALGVRYASRAGWDPDGVPQLLTTLGRIEESSDDKGVPNWLQTHPPAEDRVARVQQAVKVAEEGATRFTTDKETLLNHVDGVMWGDNPDQGVIRGSSFLHPTLRFSIDFPEGWTITNGETQVVARESSPNVLMLLETAPNPQGQRIRDVALGSMQRAGFRAASGGETTINGLPAFIGTYQGAVSDVGQIWVRAAHIVLEGTMFVVAGIATPAAFERVEPAFSKAIHSFRPLTRAQAEEIHPNRIALYTARQGDTWQGIAERAGKGTVKASTLAIMNGHPVDDQPRAGERLKVVVLG